MNRKLFGALTIAVLAFVMNVSAQTKEKANVPFDFVAGDQALPAGTYAIDELASHVIGVRNTASNQEKMISMHSAERLNDQSPKLVFHKYGDSYFLYQVWTGSSEGLEINQSKREKEANLASNQGSAPQDVVVALR